MIEEVKPKYPILEVDLKKIRHNTKKILTLCHHQNISVTGIIKRCNALSPVIQSFIDCGCDYLGTSRIDQLIPLKEAGFTTKTMLIRIPMSSEIAEVVAFSDVSLNSEKSTLLQLEQEALGINPAI